MHSSERLKADSILLLVAVIWGTAFVAQRLAAQILGFFMFNGLRFLLGALFLLVLMRFRVELKREDWLLTALAATALLLGSVAQQAGISWTTAGNAGFITGLYVVLVPLVLLIGWKQKVGLRAWLAAGLAGLGALLLSTGGLSLHLAPGDAFELVGAFFWSLHVILIGRAAQRIHPLPFTFGQLALAGSVQLILGLLFEHPHITQISASIWPIGYTGIFSIGLAYALQAFGQRHAPPSDAALLLSLEATFAVIFGWLILGERMGPVQIGGCGLIFLAILISQIKATRSSEA